MQEAKMHKEEACGKMGSIPVILCYLLPYRLEFDLKKSNNVRWEAIS